MDVRATQTCGATVLVLGLLALGRPAAAIPAFARKYATGCATCHVTVDPNWVGKLHPANDDEEAMLDGLP